ncbi:unnamed protein product [Schistocephalus solidus]|uniref:AMP-binding domain-containing protein n=1 Tax=Schistocephalus solidus TaxID=70667 RepID=A0A183TQ27_SCHSO|nr:unnamed protein product [Schistocephalus solidus]
MSAFLSSPLKVPVTGHSMTGLTDFLERHSFTVLPVGLIDFANELITEEFTQQLKFIPKAITVKCPSNYLETRAGMGKLSIPTAKVSAFVNRLTLSSSNDFQLAAEALVATSEISFSDLSLFDKPIYTTLLEEACKRLKTLQLETEAVESSPDLIYVPSNESDLLLVCTKIIWSFSHCRGVTVSCASERLMLPLFVLSQAISAADPLPELFSFVPAKEAPIQGLTVSSIQLILHTADVDSAARAIVYASSYHAGMTSWRPSIVLVEQDLEKNFRTKVKKLLQPVTDNGDNELLDENARLRCQCRVPSFLKADIDNLVELASGEGAEVMRASDVHGPVFVFGVTPASRVLDKYRSLPLGPCSIVLPFRTPKEGLKLAQYFSDRESQIIGTHRFRYALPKSATVWTDNSSLAWQVLAKLSGYSTLAVNSDLPRLCSSYYLTLCSRNDGERFGILPISPHRELDHKEVNSALSKELLEVCVSAKYVQTCLRKLNFTQLSSALRKVKECTPFVSSLDRIRSACLHNLQDAFTNNLQDEIAISSELNRLVSVRSTEEPAGPLLILLKSGDLKPDLIRLVLSAVALGNSVVLIAAKQLAVQETVSDFCNSINQTMSAVGTISTLGPIIQLKKLDFSEEDISIALSTVPCSGLYMVSQDQALNGTVGSSDLCRYSTVFWSAGGDLFAN